MMYTKLLFYMHWVRKTLEVETKKAKAKMMYKLLNNMGPQSLTKLFTYDGEVTSYNLRNISSNLCLPHPGTNNMKRSISLEFHSKGN